MNLFVIIVFGIIMSCILQSACDCQQGLSRSNTPINIQSYPTQLELDLKLLTLNNSAPS